MKIQKLLAVLFLLLFATYCGFIPEDPEDPDVTESWPPMQEALDAMESDNAVTVKTVYVADWKEASNYYYVFEPNKGNQTTAFIFYPGGLVDPRAYAPPIRAITEAGYLTFIVKMPQDLAPFGTRRANTIIDGAEYSFIEKWAIGGHSVGGTFACAFAKDFTEQLDGIAIWASYPSESFRIDDKDLKVVLIYGTNNPNVNDDEVESEKPYLPADTTYVRIEGGNHTQFGYYDTSPYAVQPGDDNATITREEQQSQIIQATIDLLEGL